MFYSLSQFAKYYTRLNLVIKFINDSKSEDEYELAIPDELIFKIYCDFYKVLIAKEVIYSYFRWSLNCEECLIFNWKFNLLEINAFYYDDFYDGTDYYDGFPTKLVCKAGCNYKLKCGHNTTIYPHQLNRTRFYIVCEICGGQECRNARVWC